MDKDKIYKTLYTGTDKEIKDLLTGDDKENLVEVMMELIYDSRKTRKIQNYYKRETGKLKYESLTPEYVQQIYLRCEQLEEVQKIIAESKGLTCSVQLLRYKIKSYEKSTGLKIYKPMTRGRKKGTKISKNTQIE